jgi:transcriptional regulator with XRE-family HTH domain
VCSRARAFRFGSPAFRINVPAREHSCVKTLFSAGSYQAGTFSSNFDVQSTIFPLGNVVHLIMDDGESAVDRRALEAALGFGSLIRSRRKALKMRQDQLALATGVGRRFLIDLEAGKPSCQLGRSLLVAEALGLRLADILAAGVPSQSATALELPDLPEEVEEPDGRSTRIL